MVSLIAGLEISALIVLGICIVGTAVIAVAKNLKRVVPDCGEGLNGIAYANADFPHAVIAF
jgi:hypothetical protein